MARFLVARFLVARSLVARSLVARSLVARSLVDQGRVFAPRSRRFLPQVGAALAAGFFDQIQIADFD